MDGNSDPPRTPPKTPADGKAMATPTPTDPGAEPPTPPTVPRKPRVPGIKEMYSLLEVQMLGYWVTFPFARHVYDMVNKALLFFGKPEGQQGLDELNFDLKKTIWLLLGGLKKRWTQQQGEKPLEILAGGSTQNGKTAIKKAISWTNGRSGVTTIIISSTKRGTSSIAKKFFKDEQRDGKRVWPLPYMICLSESRPCTNTIREVLRRGGIVLCHDAPSRIDQISDALNDPEMRKIPLVIILDEADSFLRREDQSTKLEKALKRLFATGRVLIIYNVTATMLPVLLHMKMDGREIGANSFIVTECRSNYVGPDSFFPLQHKGKDVFLDPENEERSERAMNLLYEQAFKKKGSETLVITDRTIERMEQRADGVQKMYPHVAVMIVTNNGISLRPPLKPMFRGLTLEHVTSEELEGLKTWSAADVINFVDNRFQIETPLVIFGYGLMIRGDSFVSKQRVPDHIICRMGPKISIEKLVQACGRATYQRQATNCNIEDEKRVTILTYPLDYISVRAYPHFMAELQEKLRQPGMTLAKALSPEETYSHKANFMPPGQERSIGQVRDNLRLDVRFLPPPQ
eukprot:765232-Hanusia_phi.AAC.9